MVRTLVFQSNDVGSIPASLIILQTLVELIVIVIDLFCLMYGSVSSLINWPDIILQLQDALCYVLDDVASCAETMSYKVPYSTPSKNWMPITEALIDNVKNTFIDTIKPIALDIDTFVAIELRYQANLAAE